MLNDAPAMAHAHHYYGPIVAIDGTCMATGFTIYFVNIVRTLLSKRT